MKSSVKVQRQNNKNSLPLSLPSIFYSKILKTAIFFHLILIFIRPKPSQIYLTRSDSDSLDSEFETKRDPHKSFELKILACSFCILFKIPKSSLDSIFAMFNWRFLRETNGLQYEADRDSATDATQVIFSSHLYKQILFKQIHWLTSEQLKVSTWNSLLVRAISRLSFNCYRRSQFRFHT